jgi:glycosyltransferase involved in cell wall biosynthesis
MKRILKIGIVIDQLLPGGVQKQGIQEVTWLRKLGIDAKLVILMRKGFESKNLYLVKNCPYEFLSDRYPKVFQKSIKFPIFSFFSTLHLLSPVLAPLRIKKGEFDLIVSLGTTTSLTMWSLSIFRKIPYIAVIHDPMAYILEKVYSATVLRFFFPILNPIATFLEKRFSRAAVRCLVLSRVHAEYLEKNYGVKPEILYLPVNPPASLPAKRGAAVLAFGRWDKEKHPEVLLSLIKAFKKTKLIIAGTWHLKDELKDFKKKIRQLGLSSRVSLITGYKESELAKICAKGRVWVHPNFEAFSLSALEAASHGLPIIIPEGSGVTELFQHGEHGFFPKKPTGQILKVLTRKLLVNERLAYDMGIKAAAVARHHTPEIHTRKLLAIIYKALAGGQITKILALETGHVKGSGIAGGDRLLEEMVKRIKKRIDLTVIVPYLAKDHWKLSDLSVTVEALPPNVFEDNPRPWGVFFTYLIRICQSYPILVGTENDTILYSSTGIIPDVVPAFLAKLLYPTRKWIARIHHLSPPPGKRTGRWWVNLGAYILQKIALSAIKAKANLILVLNRDLQKELESLGFSLRKMVVLGGGVDFNAINSFQSQRTRNYDGVFLGRLHPSKGVFDLVPIWKEVTKILPKAHLAVIGFGHKEIVEELKNKIRETGLADNITLRGFLPQGMVLSILKRSKVFLFTDHEAGFGLAVAEAMAAGLPVVGWDIGILGNVFKNGFLKAALDDHRTFASHILTLLTNKDMRLKLSKMAQKEASYMDWTKTSKKFERILKNLI